jgi:ligand-binding sensor domain-containing protein
LFEDADKNLWVGLDNGINCINLQSPIKKVCRRYGKVRTVYSSKLYDGRLYIGTNQGLFYKEYKGNGEFKFIDGTKGRFGLCLSMTEPCFADMIQEHLSLKRLQSKNIRTGTWKFESVSGQKALQATTMGFRYWKRSTISGVSGIK